MSEHMYPMEAHRAYHRLGDPEVTEAVKRLLGGDDGQAFLDGSAYKPDAYAEVVAMITRANGEAPQAEEEAKGREVVLTYAADTPPRRVRWCWEGRLAVGTLGLLAGREDQGKSTVALTIGADLTRGTLPGEHCGHPRAVLVATAEDSWDHVIVPRLLAAGADLSRVARVEVRVSEHLEELDLPTDLETLERTITDTGAALLILDPLISRLNPKLDTHRDGDVRQALEPLVKMAERTGVAIVGLIHHNKSGSADPLQLVMASKAFAAVARSVHTIVKDPDDESGRRRYFGTAKNNLGRSDLPTLPFIIEPFAYDADDDDKPGETGRVVWQDEHVESIWDVLNRANQTPEQRTKEDEAAEWLASYMAKHDGPVPAKQGVADAKAAGHKRDTLDRARRRVGIDSRKVPEFGGGWWWHHPTIRDDPPSPDHQIFGSSALSRDDDPNNNNDPIGDSPPARAREIKPEDL